MDATTSRHFTLARDAAGRLRFSDAAHANEPVTVTPAFPLSDQGRWISLRAANGQELAFAEEISGFEQAVREMIADELATRQFVPIVTRVLLAATTTTGLQVQVETDRGPATLLLDADEQIRRLGDGRIVLTDTHGVRYLIPDTRKLDSASRHRLERFY